MKKNFIFVLTIGVFSILNTEMGIVGILPAISEQYGVNLTTAGMLVSLFALAIVIAGPVMPMLMSRFERKKVMVGGSAGMVLGAPVAGLIVNSSTLRVGLLFFAAINLISLIATILFVPEFTMSEKTSYGQQQILASLQQHRSAECLSRDLERRLRRLAVSFW